ncbi:hypothetical protein [Nodosilinea nodulosa]|uniref:hypothetical protein n=1 Tax=Nodosilinea nodulosa TaxID=416001 RepID=UPI0003088F4E|nr:hypothetical protein [Nodosilinea nodulosa]
MSLPPALRYRLVRLQPIGRQLRRPTVWGTLAALGLMAAVGPQYFNHPEWRSQYDPAVASPAVAPGTELGTLSNDDLANLAEVDNLSLLLNQLPPNASSPSDIPAAKGISAAAADGLSLPKATPDDTLGGTESTNPFAQYLERSRFRFNPAASREAIERDSTMALGSGSLTTGPVFGSSSSETPLPFSSAPAGGPQLSPLQQALNVGSGPRAGQPSGLGAAPDPRAGASGAGSDPATATSGITPQPWMVEGSLPGVDQRFIRTTPQMSPPPGTTGYAPPPSLSPTSGTVAPAQGTTNPAALNLDFGAPVTAPAGSGQRQLQPNAIAPSAPVVPSPQPVPAPFSAPRPPGVYTGNGYINTFANPSGPGQ